MNLSVKRFRRRSSVKSQQQKKREAKEKAARALDKTKRRLGIGQARPLKGATPSPLDEYQQGCAIVARDLASLNIATHAGADSIVSSHINLQRRVESSQVCLGALMRTVPVFTGAFGAAMGLIAASTQLSLADVPLKGSFLANRECPAFLSFRKGTNPGGAKVESAHSYQLLAKNAPIATHYRVRIENASPPERWVSADCGFLQEENASSQGSGSSGGALTENRTQFVLSLGWEPGFCESHNTKSECTNEKSNEFDATHFTLHGLWPQPRKREYCDVPAELVQADRSGNWQALPIVNLSSETQERLALVMPGTRSLLDRHEWIRHGTCYGGDVETYFRQALSLVDAINSSAVQSLFASNIGKELSIGAIKDAFNSAFGTGAGDRVRLACRRDGSRQLITEITIGLGAHPNGATSLADLIKASSPTDPGCPGGIVDAVGYQ